MIPAAMSWRAAQRAGIWRRSPRGQELSKVANPTLLQPAGHSSLSEATDLLRGDVTGEQHQRAFALRVVEFSIPRGKYAGHHIAETVDNTDPISVQVTAVPDQQAEATCQVGGLVDDGEIPAVASGLGEENASFASFFPSPAYAALIAATIGPGCVSDRLTRASQQQRRGRGDDVDSPHDLLRERGHRCDHCGEFGFIVHQFVDHSLVPSLSTTHTQWWSCRYRRWPRPFPPTLTPDSCWFVATA